MGELINGRTPEEIKRVLEWAKFACGDLVCEECPYYENVCSHESYEKIAPDALALIEHLEAKIPKWISVENELPKKPGTYLCNYEFEESGRIVMSCDYLGDKRWSFMTAHVTHWAPMLEDPKASDDHAGESEV